jgi:hypothetical protein
MNKTILIILIVVIVAGVFLYIKRGHNNNYDYKDSNNIMNNPNNSNNLNKFNTDIALQVGESVTLGTLKINFQRVSLPPQSFTGDKAEYTFANMEAVEEGDAFNFSLHFTKRPSQVFHEYEIFLKSFEPEKNQVTILVEQKPTIVKVKEIDAVKTALIEASKTDLPQPEVLNRSLKNGVWEMEVDFEMSDIYLIVKIDAETGKVLETIKENRA